MARAPRKATTKRKASPPAKRGSTAVTDWKKQMEEQANAATDMEKGAALGRAFSFKGGKMMFDGQPVQGNRAIVVIADAIIEKGFYDGAYDPDNPEPPACYAFGYDPDEIAPNEEDVADLQCESCELCELNKFGSADTGKGKACKDVRRLMLIPAGKYTKGDDIELYDDPDHFARAEMATAKIPPTSLNAYASFVRQVAGTMKRPPHGIFAEMICEPDDRTQFKVFFEPIDMVPDDLMPAVMERHEEAKRLIAQPYTYPSEEEKKPAKRGGRKPSGRKASGGTKRKRKY